MPDGPTEFRSRLSGRAARPALNPGESALRLVWHPWHASCEALIRRRAIAVSPNRRVVRDVQDSRVQPAHLTRLTVRRLSVVAERVAWTFGSVCLLTYGVMHVDGAVGARQELARVAQVQSVTVASPRPPDMSLWGSERIIAWRRASLEPAPPPLAVLRIPKIHLEVPVLPGTDDFTLNRAVGHIEDTALPGADGNSGIAGHRDGFFRGLKDVVRGDDIELETLRGKEMYRIDAIWVVSPEDVAVLDPTPTRSLTLVTCYPFYHIGPAPQRYIVRAGRVERK